MPRGRQGDARRAKSFHQLGDDIGNRLTTIDEADSATVNGDRLPTPKIFIPRIRKVEHRPLPRPIGYTHAPIASIPFEMDGHAEVNYLFAVQVRVSVNLS